MLCRLTEEAALAADVLPPSPSVPGMSVERRDRYLRKLRAGLDAYLAMFEKQNGNNAKAATEVRAKELNKLEHNMGSLLLALRWTNEPPHWAEEEWWKGEIAWVAPWTAELGEYIDESVL